MAHLKRVIGISQGMSGWYAVLYDDEDVIQTGIGRYPERGGAEVEAAGWAEAEGIDLDFEIPQRHRWLKLRLHTYICRKCGTGRVNALVSGGWQTTYHRPDGTSEVLSHVPPCERGPKTDAALAKYATELAAPVRATVDETTADAEDMK